MLKNYNLYRINDIEKKLRRIETRTLDVMVTGATGAGKSTTINRLFNREVAVIGEGVDPQTMEVKSYELNPHLRLWDTPGLGDGVARAEIHKKNIITLLEKNSISGDAESKCTGLDGKFVLSRADETKTSIAGVINNAATALEETMQAILREVSNSFDSGYKLIDLVLIILESNKKDLGTTYTLLNDVILPYIPSERILFAINKADFGMKGHHWISESDRPDETLLAYLSEQASSVQQRMFEATGKKFPMPIFYSAEHGYNVDKLLDFIIDHMPQSRLNA